MKHNFKGFEIEIASQEAYDVSVESTGASEVVHDDGFMHVRHDHTCYSFDIGQEHSKAEYNKRANLILAAIGVSGKVTGFNN